MLGHVEIISSALMLAGALVSATAQGSRRSVMGLWMGQLGAGSILLTAEAELLAVLLWISATVACAVYFLHADLFQEGETEGATPLIKRLASQVFPAAVSAGFGAVVYFLFTHAMEWSSKGFESLSQRQGLAPWKDERMIALELTALFVLAVTVGAGVISRSRKGEQ